MLSKENKKKVIAKYGQNKEDNGSSAVQVALLTARINGLTDHFKQHPKDHTSRRGLIKMVGERRRLLNYISRKNIQQYRTLIESLNLRK